MPSTAGRYPVTILGDARVADVDGAGLCPKEACRTGPAGPIELSQPILPATSAPIYTAKQTLPADDLVAQVALGLVW